jgi:hypothetical protein
MVQNQAYDYASLRYGPRALSEELGVDVIAVRRWFAGGGIVTTFVWNQNDSNVSLPYWMRESGYLRMAR